MKRFKGLFVKDRGEEFEVPRNIETRVTQEPGESRLEKMRRLIVKRPPPQLVPPYEDVKARLGMRVPALRLFSADPYSTMSAYSADRNNIQLTLPPNVPYPIVWEQVENWRPPMMSESETQLLFQIPLGQTYARLGVKKSVTTMCWATVPIVQMPWGLARMGIIGREQFDLDVVSGDFDTRTELSQQRYQIERLKAMKSEKSFREVVDSTRGMPETQKSYTYDSLLRSLGLGGTKELLASDDPEAAIERKIELLTEMKNRYRGSKR